MNRDALLAAARWLLVAVTATAVLVALVLDRPYSTATLFLVPTIGYLLVGFLVSSRRPENPIGWIFLLVGLFGSLIGLVSIGSDAALDAAAADPAHAVMWWEVLAAWGYSLLWFPAVMLITTFTFLLFPAGLPSRRWRPVLWLAVASTLATSLVLALAPTVEIGDPSVGEATLTFRNPLSPPWVAGIDHDVTPAWVQLLFAVSVLCAVASIVAVGQHMWRSQGVERQQMRLFAFAVALFPLQNVLSSLTGGFGNPTVDDLSFTVVMAFMPVACGLAILRYHLYDIDRIIGRTTAYAIVTGLLVGVYAVVVTSVTRLLPGSSNAFAVAAATLTAAAVFRPALTRVQGFVDQRFNRTRYDAQRTVEAFAARLRDEVTPEAVTADLLVVLQTTIQPSGAALWLKAGAP